MSKKLFQVFHRYKTTLLSKKNHNKKEMNMKVTFKQLVARYNELCATIVENKKRLGQDAKYDPIYLYLQRQKAMLEGLEFEIKDKHKGD